MSPDQPEAGSTGPKPGPTRRPRETKSGLDLGPLFAKAGIKVEIHPRESPREIESRLLLAEAQAAHERRKEWAGIMALAIIGAVCLGVAVGGGAPEDRKWAMSVLSLLVGGVLGYLTGRASRSQPGP